MPFLMVLERIYTSSFKIWSNVTDSIIYDYNCYHASNASSILTI